MKVLIDIPKEDFIKAKEDSKNHLLDRMWNAVAHGTPLPTDTCEDAISRKAVLDVIEREQHKGDDISEIKKLPSVTPVACIATVKFSKEDMQELVEEKMKDIVVERKKGKWEYSGSYDVEGMLYCSCCKHEIDVSEGYFKYCPNCGSFMMKEN
jgi:Zn finger protein HypA/HybF involved in hydrogenase expression